MSSERTENPFDTCSREYSRFRPDYPEALHDYLTRRRPTSVLDVGAGTGKGSVPFLRRGIPVVSAEPSPQMAREGLEHYPRLQYVGAEAERLPFRAETFDMVSAAQAFHWFRPETALPEFARVLRPQGLLAVFWNSRDLSVPAVQAFERLVSEFNPEHVCGYRRKDWNDVIESTGHFKVLEVTSYPFESPMSVSDWIGLARSVSYVRKIGNARMPDFEKALEHELAQLPSTHLRYVTNCWLSALL
jgi:ubiquinone/menaquinone biosynthesis C-methylase UbiE